MLSKNLKMHILWSVAWSQCLAGKCYAGSHDIKCYGCYSGFCTLFYSSSSLKVCQLYKVDKNSVLDFRRKFIFLIKNKWGLFAFKAGKWVFLLPCKEAGYLDRKEDRIFSEELVLPAPLLREAS